MPETTHNRSAVYAKTYAAILALALLAGCATAITAETAVSGVESAVAPSSESAVCDTDADTFCIESDKQLAARLYQQGLKFAAQEDYGQALQSFKQAIDLDSTNPAYRYSLGVTYHLMGMLEEEESAYMDVLAIEPDDPNHNPVLSDTYYNLACLYALQGKKDQAFAQLDKLLILEPKSLYHDIQSDKDLDSLREDPRYKQLMANRFKNTVKPEDASKPEDPAKTYKSGKSKKRRKSKKSVNSKKPVPPEAPVK